MGGVSWRGARRRSCLHFNVVEHRGAPCGVFTSSLAEGVQIYPVQKVAPCRGATLSQRALFVQFYLRSFRKMRAYSRTPSHGCDFCTYYAALEKYLRAADSRSGSTLRRGSVACSALCCPPMRTPDISCAKDSPLRQ